MRRFIAALTLLMSLVTARMAGAALITYEFTATITDIEVLAGHPRGPEMLARFTSLGGVVGGRALGTFVFDDGATPYGTDPTRFNSNRPGGLAGLSFGTADGLSIDYSPLANLNMVATPE